MTNSAVEQRRDPRYNLNSDYALFEFDDPARPEIRWSGRLVSLSAAGICLEIDGLPELESVAVLPDVTLQIGNCRIAGNIAIKNVRALDGDRLQIGGLFYPGSEMEMSKLMALIAGRQACDCSSEARKSQRRGST